MVKNTACYPSTFITVQAGLRVRKLALHSNRSYLLRFSLQSGAFEHESCACSRDPGEKCGLKITNPAQKRRSFLNKNKYLLTILVFSNILLHIG